MARKPLSESTVAANVLRWGTGGLNIDASRVGTGENLKGGRYCPNAKGADGNTFGAGINAPSLMEYEQPAGRWPANVIFSPEAAAELDRQSGLGKSGFATSGESKPGQIFGFGNDRGTEPRGYADSGGASRFFFVAKPSQAERCAGLDDGNPHPTVKPLELFSYLIRLVTPPGGIVLDPFTGSGSSGMAAVNGGFGFIGMEKEIDYFAIAQSRIRHSKGETGLFAED